MNTVFLLRALLDPGTYPGVDPVCSFLFKDTNHQVSTWDIFPDLGWICGFRIHGLGPRDQGL